jgi:hypothetical protein
MQTISLSANIETGFAQTEHYLVTPNVQKAVANIVEKFNSGIHSFTIIGSYGTGKSSFLIAFEEDLNKKQKQKRLFNPEKLSNLSDYEVINIVGDYDSLSNLLRKKLNTDDDAEHIIDYLRRYYDKLKAENKFLVIAIDEFGKVLEHAAQNNPEDELFFIQKFAEFVNVQTRNIILLTTLHQNFGAYSKKLTESQKNEWTKVKGRFQEITFIEPSEVLLNLVAQKLQKDNGIKVEKNAEILFNLAHETKIVTAGFAKETAENIYPLDPFSAVAITEAIQRYGQNERSLFSFMVAKGSNSPSKCKPNKHLTYNLADVYDYVNYIFYSVLKDAHSDSMQWGAIATSIGRAENIEWQDNQELESAVKIIKAIGILNLFANASSVLTISQMQTYAENAMEVANAESVIKKLIQFKIVRFAIYNNRLKLFAGTDVDLDAEIVKAGSRILYPTEYIDELTLFFNKRISPAKACYYQKGTPRFFDYEIKKEPVEIVPNGDIDGYIELIFSDKDDALENVKSFSEQTDNAIIFAFFKNTGKIVDHLYNIQKYNYILTKVLLDKHDDVANNEIKKLREYEESLLNKEITENLFSYNNAVTWVYKGETKTVNSLRDFNVLISDVCNDVYSATPVMNNELFNRHKLSSQIATARNYLIRALLNNNTEKDLGFAADKFPPEKTIYYSLLKDTGLHNENGLQDHPKDKSGIDTLWEASMNFLKSSVGKPQKLSELVKNLSEKPYKLKQGFIDFWLPVFLIVKRNDYALYETESGAYCPKLEEYMFDLLPKKPGKYSVKMFTTEGVNIEFFNQYRKFIQLPDEFAITSDKIIETIKPFLFFYNRLNDYTKHTKKFNKKSTMCFRDVLAKAKDPEKTFFEDLPQALGFKDTQDFDTYGETLQNAIRELRMCYTNLIDRIEKRLIEELGLQHTDYQDYVVEIQSRLANVKTHLLTRKQEEFYNHAILKFDDRTLWYQAICYPVLEHDLEEMQDSEEEKMLDELVFLFRECEQCAEVSKAADNDKTVEAFSFGMATNKGTNLRTQTYVLRKQDKKRATELEKIINDNLSGDGNLDICILLKILEKKMKKK